MIARIAWWLWALAVVAIIAAPLALAAPVAVADGSGVKITLFDEACRLDTVSNFKFRATWEEGGKLFEGCYGGNYGVIVAYFSDKTVAIMPLQAFVKVQGV